MILTDSILKFLVKDYLNTADPDVRASYGILEGWISIAVNFIVFVIKLVPGILAGSISLIADAFHSLSDAGSSIIILVGFKVSRKPSDADHPFGHERAEYITALIVAILVAVTGVEFMRASVVKILHPTEISAGWGMIIMIASTIIAKEFLALFAKDLGKRIGSGALEGDFWHHRTDSISTVFVVAALIGSKFGFSGLDGYAGIFVSIIIIYAGYRIARDSVNPLLGEAPDPGFIKTIESIAFSHGEVEGVHDIIVHTYGSFRLASLHIEVSDSLHPLVAHELAEHIEDDIEKALKAKSVIHVDPVNRDYEYYGAIEEKIGIISESDDSVLSFHDLRIVGKGDRVNIVFDIVTNRNVKKDEHGKIKKRFVNELKDSFPFIRAVVITVEESYSGPAKG